MAPPQYSQRPLASGMVVAPQKGQVTAVLGALAATALSRVSWRSCTSASRTSVAWRLASRYSMEPR